MAFSLKNTIKAVGGAVKGMNPGINAGIAAGKQAINALRKPQSVSGTPITTTVRNTARSVASSPATDFATKVGTNALATMARSRGPVAGLVTEGVKQVAGAVDKQNAQRSEDQFRAGFEPPKATPRLPQSANRTAPATQTASAQPASYPQQPAYTAQGSISGYSSGDPAVQERIKQMQQQATGNPQKVANPGGQTMEYRPERDGTPTMQTMENRAGNAGQAIPLSAQKSVIDQLRGRIGDLSQMSAEEKALNDELAQFRGDARMGIAGLEGQGRGIPLGLVRGQQAKLGEQASLQEQTLLDRLASASAARQSQLTAAQTEFNIANAEQERMDKLTAPLTVGNSILRFNPETKQYETAYSAPSSPSDPLKVGAGETVIDPTTGQVIYSAPQGLDSDRYASSGGVIYDKTTGQVVYTSPVGGNSSGGAGGAGGGVDLTAGQQTALADMNTTLDSIANVQQMLEAGGFQTGPVSNFTQGLAGTFGIGQNQSRIAFDASLSALKANFIKALSGAAVSEGEIARLSKFLPSTGDQEDTIRTKLSQLNAELQRQRSNFLQVTGGGGTVGSGDDIDQFLDSFSNAGGQALNGSKAVATVAKNYPVGSWGAQCGRFVNRIAGTQMGNTYQSKMAYVDKSIGSANNPPRPGDIFVMPYKQYGHTGFVADGPWRPQSDGSSDIPVLDSNYGLDEKVQYHYINSKKISGFARRPLATQKVSLA